MIANTWFNSMTRFLHDFFWGRLQAHIVAMCVVKLFHWSWINQFLHRSRQRYVAKDGISTDTLPNVSYSIQKQTTNKSNSIHFMACTIFYYLQYHVYIIFASLIQTSHLLLKQSPIYYISISILTVNKISYYSTSTMDSPILFYKRRRFCF